MGFAWEKISVRGQEKIRITGYEGTQRIVAVPSEIEGLPVAEIGKSAFSGKENIEELVLPETVKTLHLFAFQNCVNLKKISLFNTCDDYYDGVIRGCRALREIEVHMKAEDNTIIIREFLRDTDAALRFVLLYGEKTLSRRIIRLTFPEYVSEAREDTMARAIHFNIEGAGMAYRECVSKKGIDFAGYDVLFPRLTDYDFREAADICMDRLQTPEGLTEQAEERYKEWLISHSEKVLAALTDQGDAERVNFLAGNSLIPEEALGGAVRYASEKKQTQVCAILMAYQGRRFSKKAAPESFSLDW